MLCVCVWIFNKHITSQQSPSGIGISVVVVVGVIVVAGGVLIDVIADVGQLSITAIEWKEFGDPNVRFVVIQTSCTASKLQMLSLLPNLLSPPETSVYNSVTYLQNICITSVIQTCHEDSILDSNSS